MTNNKTLDNNSQLTELALAIHQLRTTGLATQRPDLAVLRLEGRDTYDFLQRIVSGDLSQLTQDCALYTALLTPKSTLIAPVTIVGHGRPGALIDEIARYDILLPTPLTETARDHLDRLIFSEDIEISIADLNIISAYGLSVHQDLKTGLDEKQSPGGQIPVHQSGEQHPGNTYLEDLSCGCPGVIIWSEHKQSLANIPASYRFPRAPLPAVKTDLILDALNSARIESGIPRYPNELNGERLILEAGQFAAVSLNKGCYAGQEPVCRIASRGKMQWYLRQIVSADPIHVGETLNHPDKTEAAKITSACYSPTAQQWVGLAYVHRKATDGPLTRSQGNMAMIKLIEPGSLLDTRDLLTRCPQSIRFPPNQPDQ